MAAFTSILLGIAAGATLLSGIGQAKQERETATFNALQAERDATTARLEAEEEAERIRRQGRRLRGEQIAASAASGLAGGGSLLDILADDALEIELQAQDVLRRGAISSQVSLEEASITRRIGKSRARQSILGGIGRAGSIVVPIIRDRRNRNTDDE